MPVCGQISDDVINGSPSTEIYSAQTNTWRMGPNYPEGTLSSAQTIYTRGRLFLIGGKVDGSTYSKSIYEFDKQNEKWILRDETLPIENSAHKSYVITEKTMLCIE